MADSRKDDETGRQVIQPCAPQIPVSEDRVVSVAPRLPTDRPELRRIEIEEIGKGGAATVKKIFDANLLRRCAIKKLHGHCACDDGALGRFIAEAQIMGQLDHPSIVPVHELGVDEEGCPFFTMKLVEGITLRELIKQHDVAARPRALLYDMLRSFLKVLDAMAFAHSRGVVHRDLKPDNIMVGHYGEVYVMDWGIAKLQKREGKDVHSFLPEDIARTCRLSSGIGEGVVAGTPGYMAPEQARGEFEEIDERSDIFSLGAILYTILCGVGPYRGKNGREVYIKNLTFPAEDPRAQVDADLPERLCHIALKALAREKDERYQSVLELKEDIEEFLESGWQLEVRKYAADEAIVRQDEPGREAFVITEGRCEVTRRNAGRKTRIAELGPGEVFGETALFTGSPRTATVTALEDVEVFVITKEQLEEQIGLGFFVGRIIKALAERFRDEGERVSALEVELDATEVELQVMKHMAFEGRKSGENCCEASWSDLLKTLHSKYGQSPEALARSVERLEGVIIDRGGDCVIARRKF